MKKYWKIGYVMTAAVTVLFGSYVLICGSAQIAQDLQGKISQMLQREAEQAWMPGMAFMKQERQESLGEWVSDRAAQVTPLGVYVEDRKSYETEAEDAATYEKILAMQASDENEVGADGNLIGEPDTGAEAAHTSAGVDMSAGKLKDFDYLLSHFYTVDSTTMVDESLLNAEELLAKDLKIDQSTGGPKVLIYHTHSQEMFADSTPGDASTSIVGVGEYLTELLNEKYGIETIHHTKVYDLIDGKLDRSKAYQLAEKDIAQILKDNPTIEVVIDLHRDGVKSDTHLVTDINGKETAKIMFFNGLSRTRANGEISYLKNPYIKDNLAMSLQMELAAEKLYPGFTRKIYLKGYRYNMHLKPKSMLIEAGAQTNTLSEMKNAMEVLAKILDVVLKE